MNNLFGVNAQTGEQYSELFQLRTVDERFEEKVDGALSEIDDATRRAALPLPFLIASCVFCLCGLIMITFIQTIEKGGENTTAIIVSSIGAALTLLGLAILLINYLRLNRLKRSALYLSLLEKREAAERESLKSLGVPDDAEEITLLLAFENKKNSPFFADKLKLFTENGSLCIANSYEVIGIPLNDIAAVYRIQAKTKFSFLDGEGMKKADAKRLGLKLNANDCVAPCRYSARVMHGAEELELVFPPYELEKFTKYVRATVIN